MVGGIRIYVEGGGNSRITQKELRKGFAQFFNKVLGKRIEIIPCGPRNDAYRNFEFALEDHPNAFNILLVDSESSVKHLPRQHLHQQDGWKLSNIADEQCHLMVQMMEAWLVADMEALERYYGQGFNANPIPNNPNVEDIPKQQLEVALMTATRNTTKGEYHKIRHGPRILAQLDPSRVRNAAAHCDRLFDILAGKLGTAI